MIFSSDNGGETRVTTDAPLRAGKSTLYEGGIRVPLIVRYPRLVPANTICKTPTCNIDFYPTFCDLLGIRPKPQERIDGITITPLLGKPEAKLNRDTLYWHYPLAKPHFLGGHSSGAVRKGDWKLIQFFDTAEFELYNLADDTGEKTNLADRYPDKVRQLTALLEAWRKHIARKNMSAFIPQKLKTQN